jgi:2'-5' RNA ligase
MQKRLFFGMGVKAPWPETLPYGRVIGEAHRHLTLAFLGNVDYAKMEEALISFPTLYFKVGFGAQFDQSLFLPPAHPRVVAWHLTWLEPHPEILSLYEILVKWLRERGFSPDLRQTFLPHVTVARAPFDQKKWRKVLLPLPVMVHDLNLYESLGNLTYAPLWNLPLLPPWEEMEHTADLAYRVRGKSFDQLFQHARLALSFHFPPFLKYSYSLHLRSSLEEVIIDLNHLVASVDREIGSPFKAVSFHSQLENREGILTWEMIVDV